MLAARVETLPNSCRIRVARAGRGQPIVFLHGYPENLQIWCELVPRLSGQCETIAFDWPGMGYSDPWEGGTTPSHMSDRLLALFNVWEIDRATVIGTDMGGQPALVSAARHPERVNRLVVMNCLVAPEAATSWEISILRTFRWNRTILRWMPRIVFGRAEQTFLPSGVYLPQDLRQDMWVAFQGKQVREFIIRMCSGYQGTLSQLPSYYSHIACPTLVLWGERDRHFPLRHAERLHAAIPGSRFEVIPGAEHWMAWYLADEVAARIHNFMR